MLYLFHIYHLRVSVYLNKDVKRTIPEHNIFLPTQLNVLCSILQYSLSTRCLRTRRSVSYTHLDVYKRQVFC